MGKLRPMQHSDLEQVLAWRNHPDVRRFMYTQHEITLDEHQKWFEQCSNNAKQHLLIYEENRTPLGFIQIKIIKDSIGDWGFFASPNAPKGTGRLFGVLALQFVFEKLKLHKLKGEAIAFNEGSVRYHKNLGFKQEGTMRSEFFDGNIYHDIIQFGLLASDWFAEEREV